MLLCVHSLEAVDRPEKREFVETLHEALAQCGVVP